MSVNAKFDARVVVHSEQMDWISSPMPGVSRRPLDRVGNEVARATTIVKYDPDSHFSPHVHTGGEEFIVLSGVFQDEHGDFPVGSYIRNPPQSKHQPGSELGCIIFVKLWQFDPDDRIHVRLNTHFMQPVPHRGWQGISVTSLYKDAVEEVVILDFESDANMSMALKGGAELLVLEGEISESNDVLVRCSWLRIPTGGSLCAYAGSSGAKVWLKTGHLTRVNDEVARITKMT